MKIHKVHIICIMLCFSVSLKAQFDGGFGDGFSEDTSIKNFLTNGQVAIYFGGFGDGFAVDQSIKNFLTNNQLAIYFGGNGDGFSVDTSIRNLLTNGQVAIYFGGNGDGFAVDESITNLLSGDTLAIYFGGDGDGFVVDESIKNLLSNEGIAIYFGGNGDGYATSEKTAYLIEQIKANIIAFLQGPLLLPSSPGLMNDKLREDNLLPITSPYPDVSPVNPAVFSTTGNDAIVDWVWVELRNDTDINDIISSRSALIQRDGDIVDLDGVSNITIEVPQKNYYVVVKHRNHLGVMTSSPIALSVAPVNLDFTSNETPTYGSFAQVQLSSGDMALWAGNVNGDTSIQYAGAGVLDTSILLAFILNDGSNFLNLPTWSVPGYTNNDVDMNGVAQYAGAGVLDTPYILQNILSYPGNFLGLSTWQIQEQLPEN